MEDFIPVTLGARFHGGFHRGMTQLGEKAKPLHDMIHSGMSGTRSP